MGAPSTTATASASLAYDALRPAAYSNDNAQYQPYPQDQDNIYRYQYSDAPRPTFAPLPPPPRDDPLAPSRLRYPPPSLPRPMIGSLSPHIRKQSPMAAVVTPAFTITKPGPVTPKRATDEERRAKHREAQRRFVKRKKIEMMQLKQLAVELEKRHDLLQVVSERETLARENQTLAQQLQVQKEKDRKSPTSTTQPVEEDKKEQFEVKKENQKEEESSRPEIKWEARTFEW
ncbi:hypothetical protein DVH05_018487 [Phytophthora capsici]|nr:hypothetical protein DVH05_018487 [Phytophthora capsici]|eukprot:jgi/Phyca11/19247/fgenesh1_pg.PHYCAscaffold_46_\